MKKSYAILAIFVFLTGCWNNSQNPAPPSPSASPTVDSTASTYIDTPPVTPESAEPTPEAETTQQSEDETSDQQPETEQSSDQSPQMSAEEMRKAWVDIIAIYHKIEIMSTLDQAKEATGIEPVERGEGVYYFTNLNKHAIVRIEDGKIVDKSILMDGGYSNVSESAVSDAVAAKMKPGTPYDDIYKMFGTHGLEVNRGEFMKGTGLLAQGFRWIAPNESYIVAQFGPEGKLISAAYVER